MNMDEFATEINRTSGIYLILNQVTEKTYIGSTDVSFSARWGDHARALRRGKHSNLYLQNAWNKYGKDAFIFLVLESMLDAVPEEILEAEQWYFDNTKTHKHNGGGYNIAVDAKSFNRGCKLSEEHKLKISIAGKGRIFSKSHRAKLSAANLGRIYTKETRKKLSESHKGQQNNVKLKESEVLEIRRLYGVGIINQINLSKMFCVHKSNISSIIHRKTWKNL